WELLHESSQPELTVRKACLTPERPICSMLPSAFSRYRFQIRYGCWSLLYGAELPLNFVYHAMFAVYNAVLVPSGSPGIVASKLPSLTLLRRVEDGANAAIPSIAPVGPLQFWQPTGWVLKVSMNRSASYTAPGTPGTATPGHGYGLHTRSICAPLPWMKTSVFRAMSAISQPAASGAPMRWASNGEITRSAARIARVRLSSTNSNITRSL